MNICGFNFFNGEKGAGFHQLLEIKDIFNSNSKNNFNIQNKTNISELQKYDFFVTCGDVKITFNRI